jgi:hypothetical protein
MYTGILKKINLILFPGRYSRKQRRQTLARESLFPPRRGIIVVICLYIPLRFRENHEGCRIQNGKQRSGWLYAIRNIRFAWQGKPMRNQTGLMSGLIHYIKQDNEIWIYPCKKYFVNIVIILSLTRVRRKLLVPDIRSDNVAYTVIKVKPLSQALM